MGSEAEQLLYRAIRELDYVQSIEDCTSGLCASREGAEIVKQGMALLGVKNLASDDLVRTNGEESGE